MVICVETSVSNMKAIISVLFACVLLGSHAVIGGPTDHNSAEKDVLHKQKALFELLQHPYQSAASIFKPEHLNVVKSFDFEKNYDSFHPDAVDNVKEFYHMYKKGFLMPSDELFSIYNYNHRRQAIALFQVLYNAKGMSGGDLRSSKKSVCFCAFSKVIILLSKQIGIHSTRQSCGLVTM